MNCNICDNWTTDYCMYNNLTFCGNCDNNYKITRCEHEDCECIIYMGDELMPVFEGSEDIQEGHYSPDDNNCPHNNWTFCDDCYALRVLECDFCDNKVMNDSDYNFVSPFYDDEWHTICYDCQDRPKSDLYQPDTEDQPTQCSECDGWQPYKDLGNKEHFICAQCCDDETE